MLVPAFQLHLQDPVATGLLVVGKLAGQHQSLAFATTGGKICIHSPHQLDAAQPQVQYLNVNKEIIALAAGCLDPALGHDLLFIGTPTHLQAYDVEKNQDIFFKEVQDGVNAIAIGKMGPAGTTLVIVGGNCSIQGYDALGNEQFWTVTGDNVTSMVFCDVNGDGHSELVVGSDDFDIRTFKDEDIIAETSEADRVVGLTPVQDSKFGYALANGTIGVYNNTSRVWRVKSKHSVGAICAHDLDGDGEAEVISGWSNGRLEVRKAGTGQVIFKALLPSAVAAIVKGDLRGDGTQQIVVCSIHGEVGRDALRKCIPSNKVRGYVPVDPSASPQIVDAAAQQAQLTALAQRRQELQYQLQKFEANSQAATGGAAQQSLTPIPANTKIDLQLRTNMGTRSCCLVLQTNNEAVIKGVMLFAEQVFGGESFFYYPRPPASQVEVPLNLKKDAAVNMLVKVLVGGQTSSVYHVLEMELQLPRFSMYASVDAHFLAAPPSSVTFDVSERPSSPSNEPNFNASGAFIMQRMSFAPFGQSSRLAVWMEHRFSGTQHMTQNAAGVACSFLSLRDGRPLTISMNLHKSGQIQIRTDDMQLAAELVQDIAAFLGVLEMDCLADFPAELEEFGRVLDKVQEHNATRIKMTAEMADSSNIVKALIVKAEDARILRNISQMRTTYSQLQDLNRELIMEHTKRATNHAELLEALRQVNHMIQKAAKLRVGAPKARIVSACRAAVKENNTNALLKIIREGSESL